MSYLDYGYNNLLSRQNNDNQNAVITGANVDALIASDSIGYEQTSLKVISGTQTLKSSNFVGGQSGWIIRGDGSAEFQSLAAGEFVKVYSQATAPTGTLYTGDIWYDTDDGNKRYVYDGSAWILDTSEANWSEVIDDDGNKPADNADVTSANPQPLTWVTDAGAMAYEDLVEAAKLGTTIVSGGYIKTSLLTADNITTGTLVGLTIKTDSTAYPAAKLDSGGVSTYGETFTLYNASGGDETIMGVDTSGDFNLAPAGDKVIINGGTEGVTIEAYGFTDLNINVTDAYAQKIYIGSTSIYLENDSGTLKWNGSAIGGGGITWSTAVDANIVPDGAYTRVLGSATYPFSSLYVTTIYFAKSGETTRYMQMGSSGSIETTGSFYSSATISSAKLKLPVGTNVY